MVYDKLALKPIVDELTSVFTNPSFRTSTHDLFGWIMCLGNYTLHRVGYSAAPRQPPDHSQKHTHDGYYNFFE